MNEIVRSRNAMLLATLGAALGVLGEVMGVVAFAILNVNNATAFTDLGHAHDWLFFVGSLVVLGAVGLVAWERVTKNRGVAGTQALELFGATIATLFLAIGSLVSAASSESSTGDTLTAVGIGLWGLLALSRAGRHNMADRQTAPNAGIGRLTAIWLGVTVGLILFAVGTGIGFGVSSQGSSIASGVIAAIGIAVWAGAIAVARNHQLLTSPLVGRVLVALGLAAASYVAEAVVAATVFGPGGTLTGLQVGGALIEGLLGMAIAAFGYAAWLRVTELPVSAPTVASAAPWAPPPVPSPAGPGRFCSSCGAALPPGVGFCSSCGTQVPPAR